MEDEVEIRKVQGLELILKSINCEKYKSKFENHGINEHTFIQLIADDLRLLDIDNKDINIILTAINVLNKTLNHSEIRLSNDEILKLQSKICGQLGYIVLVLNHLHSSMVSDKNHLNDMLIDNHISAIDAALMLKPYMRAEEKNIENSLKNVFKLAHPPASPYYRNQFNYGRVTFGDVQKNRFWSVAVSILSWYGV